MEKRVYEIQGIEVYQTEMTLGQDLELIRVFRELQGKVNWSDPTAILDQILNAGLLDRVLKIILRGEVAKIDVNEITNSELEVILTDFFELNGGLIGRLRDLLRSTVVGLVEEGSEEIPK
jgi:hypothetical protein